MHYQYCLSFVLFRYPLKLAHKLTSAGPLLHVDTVLNTMHETAKASLKTIWYQENSMKMPLST